MYQPAKSLKLKLINAADDGGGKKENDGGFMGYFNKAVTKIKGINQEE